jgi:hypothetical protein
LVGNPAFKAVEYVETMEAVKVAEQGAGFGLGHRSKSHNAKPIVQPRYCAGRGRLPFRTNAREQVKVPYEIKTS